MKEEKSLFSHSDLFSSLTLRCAIEPASMRKKRGIDGYDTRVCPSGPSTRPSKGELLKTSLPSS